MSSQNRQSSSSSTRNSTSTRSETNPAVESAVTRLLVSIKQLLEALTQWSLVKVDEGHVSDVYVRLGNDFNAAVAAFGAFNIDMNELMSVPDELRNVLEQCLAEDATPENLELYLPTVRQIITGLLQGLRGKQSIYRRIVSDHKHRSDQSGHDRTESRSSRSSKSHRKQLSRSTTAESESRRSGTGSSSRKREISSSQADSDGYFAGGFSPSISETPEVRQSDSNDFPNPHDTRQPDYPGSPRSPPPPPVSPPPPAQTAPANVRRYSLVDKPVTSSSPPSVVVVEPTSPDPERTEQPEIQQPQPRTNGFPPPPPPPPDSPLTDTSQAPAMASSLAALKKSDALERRASKRFSTYNISKMTGAVGRDRPGRNPSNRRSLAVSSALTPGELAVLTEVDDEEASPSLTREGSARSRSRATTPDNRNVTPPVPPLPSTSTTPEPVTPEPMTARPSDPEVKRGSGSKITVFLQLGREVKKASLEPGISFSSLRMLFVDKFSYNPGQENFPAIYIRDPSSGVQYELEDMDEVKEKCLMSLNIEPLDQIKQHIDFQISNLSQDIKELRSTVAANQRHSTHIPNLVSSPIAESAPVLNRPTDRQFQNVARRLSRFRYQCKRAFDVLLATHSFITWSSFPSDDGSDSSVPDDRRFDEVQNLRRDLGIMRQLYTEFMKQTKDSLGTLRTQTQSVKQLATANVGGSRAFIDSGKQKLDERTQNVLTEVERLQDTIESLKDDVLKRHITPKALQLKTVKKDMDSIAAELDSLKEHFKTIKPMWKKTWAEELQNIVEEQKFLTHQEELLSDLLEIIKDTGSGRRVNGRGFKPPVAEEGSRSLNNVMMEIRTASVDPEKRMKAIEASQKNRQKGSGESRR
ncbi:AIP3-domain-containing protein [Gymnopus androsaceus JB14]|uniref:AIP3-domain-containing protein n=1 Tax=Gymnopus androsaceus JB14 TaxID=1447944 RepID=A0A6A4I6P7_9AGAR|nr:AIP3-domain-containing protein [Gymnopus androsaceus JB14]